MSFGKLGALGRGFGHLGAGGQAGAPHNTLRARAGSFTLTGTDMTPKSAYVVPAALGTFALTGIDATLTYTSSGSSATLDPSGHASNITLSNGNLTAATTVTDANGNIARSTTSHASGKYYVTAHVDGTANFVLIGVVNASASFLNSHFIGEDTNGMGWGNNAKWWFNGSSTLTNAPTIVSGATVGLAVDRDNGKAWITIDGGTTWNNDVIGNQNPVGAVGGIAVPSGALFFAVEGDNSGNQWTVNFGPGGGPSGFGNW